MGERTPVPLSASPVEIGSDDFRLIANWPFADEYVSRILKSDIQRRLKYSNGRMWIFRDPLGQPVGVGTFDICYEYGQFTNGRMHPYIPLLAVNPTIQSLGYGTSILRYLIAEAAISARYLPMFSDVLFLDVYTSNHRAISLYERMGFQQLSNHAFHDPLENSQYLVMGLRVSVAKSDCT
jgi:ribosomal protein S18 acetylase RimI-like enzyme